LLDLVRTLAIILGRDRADRPPRIALEGVRNR
jgi:hypothetical protein